MKQKRRNFTSSFKTKVVLEALKERETIQQLGVKYAVHPNQITTWKKQFLENADAAFGQDDTCDADSCIWWRLSMCTAGILSAGRCRTRWMPAGL